MQPLISSENSHSARLGTDPQVNNNPAIFSVPPGTEKFHQVNKIPH